LGPFGLQLQMGFRALNCPIYPAINWYAWIRFFGDHPFSFPLSLFNLPGSPLLQPIAVKETLYPDKERPLTSRFDAQSPLDGTGAKGRWHLDSLLYPPMQQSGSKNLFMQVHEQISSPGSVRTMRRISAGTVGHSPALSR
jgi:hypothetical protein